MRDTLAGLSDAELDAVVRFVDALVARDREILDRARAYDHGAEPFLYVDDYYGDGRGVDLVAPPGDPRQWFGGVIRADDDPRWVHVEVDMYDTQHGVKGEPGENDLTLEVELMSDDDGALTITMEGLHAM